MTKKLRTSKLVGAITTLALTASMSACGFDTPPHGTLAEDQRILASCNKAALPAADIQIDGTGSSATKEITEARTAAVESIVRTTAICSGRVRVSVFSSSSTATATLFDGALPLHGATDNARLKRVPKAIEKVMAQVRSGYAPASKRLDRGGSDITAQYRRAGEWAVQLGGRFRLHLYLLTDGFQNVGTVKLGSRTASAKNAPTLATRVPVPRLPKAEITVAGIGRVAGKPPASATTEGLVTFYDALCRRTGAARCISVTDYAVRGQ